MTNVSIAEDGKNFKVDFETNPLYFDDIVTPVFTFRTYSPYGGWYAQTASNEKVVLTLLPDREGNSLIRLDDRTLMKVLKPSLAWVNTIAVATNAAAGPVTGSYIEAVALGYWDSSFGDRAYKTIARTVLGVEEKFYYGGEAWDNSEINYFMGGYMVAAFLWPRSAGWAGALANKKAHELIGVAEDSPQRDRDIARCKIWFDKGFDYFWQHFGQLP